MTRIDLHDTESCPVAGVCLGCGIVECAVSDPASSVMTVTTASSALGVFCVTLCPDCLRTGVGAMVGVVTAIEMVMRHCEHLGIDVDQMAEQMAEAEAVTVSGSDGTALPVPGEPIPAWAAQGWTSGGAR